MGHLGEVGRDPKIEGLAQQGEIGGFQAVVLARPIEPDRRAPVGVECELRVGADPDFDPRGELVNPSLDWLAQIDEAQFERLFNGSPVRRAGFLGLRRNIAIAMGNSGLDRFTPLLTKWAGAADQGLRSAAQWARARLRATENSTTPR